MEDDKFQKNSQSFIPKESFGGNFYYRNRTTGVWGVLATIIFILSFGSLGVIYGYSFFLENRIKANNDRLAEVRRDFNPELVEELLKFDIIEEKTKDFISRYPSTFLFLRALGNSTASGISYNDLSYNFNPNQGIVTFSATGESVSYGALDFQERFFNQEGVIINTVFNNFSLNNQGNINFNLEGSVNKQAMSYDNFFTTLSSVIVGEENNQEDEN